MSKKADGSTPAAPAAAVEQEAETPFSLDGIQEATSPGGDGEAAIGKMEPRVIPDLRFSDGALIYQLDEIRGGLYMLRVIGRMEDEPV